MPALGAYEGLSFADQFLHSIHFMLCTFAVLIAFIPLLTEKGSVEHKFGGMIYLPISMAALLLATGMAWHEASFILFCFNGFCAYLLMSGWRAVHEKEKPTTTDWMIPTGLALLAAAAVWQGFHSSEGTQGFCLLMFAWNGFYLAWRDWTYLRARAQLLKFGASFANENIGKPAGWMGRHIAGMAGSMVANLSVVVLTLLPLSLHWLWPAALILMAGIVALREHQKKQRVRAAMAQFLPPKFVSAAARRKPPRDDILRAA